MSNALLEVASDGCAGDPAGGNTLSRLQRPRVLEWNSTFARLGTTVPLSASWVRSCVVATVAVAFGYMATPAIAQGAAPGPPPMDQAQARSAPIGALAEAGALFRPLSPGEHLVVVRGFRLDSKVFPERLPALHEGFGRSSLIPACDTGPCGFVVLPVTGGYRLTSVVSGSETELVELARDMERDNLSLVIVHPPASRLKRLYVYHGGGFREIPTPGAALSSGSGPGEGSAVQPTAALRSPSPATQPSDADGPGTTRQPIPEW
jgi:hypothetical protein